MNKKQLEKLLQKPQARKLAAETSIEFFARYYLEKHVRTQLGRLHKEWYDLVTKHKKIAIAAPRGHSKSTVFSLVYPLWCILFNKIKFGVIISDSMTQAADLLGAIIEELETNERIIKDFGRIAGYVPPSLEDKKKWSTKEIVTTTDVKMVAKSWNSRIRGIRYKENRPDLIVVDDLENDENVQSEDQRGKVKRVFGRSIMQLGSQDVQIIVVGTILHFDSLLQNILDNPGEGWYTKIYRAIKDDGSILWPEWWTMEKFESIRNDPQVGEIGFQQEFMNNPLDPSQQIIKPQAWYEGSIDLTMVDLFGFIDLAISEKETADYTAVVTVGKSRTDGKIYVVNAVRLRGGISDQLELVFNLRKQYNYRVFGIESVAYQKAFYQVLTKEMQQRKEYIPTLEVEVDRDKVRRAGIVAPYVDNGTVVFNKGFIDFNNELIQFPKAKHDDYVDAFVGAVQLALIHGGQSVVKTRKINYGARY